MMKWIVALMMVVMGSPTFSEEPQNSFNEEQNEALALLYVSYANGCLLADEPLDALEFFEQASVLIGKTDPSFNFINFFLYFGQVAAFDYLGMRDSCNQAIGSLILLVNEEDEDDDDDDDILTEGESALFKLLVQVLNSIASKAPSQEVRNLLLGLVDEMACELLPCLSQQE
jgi:hypothetical protein